LIFEYFFQKSVEKIQVSLKSDKKSGTLHAADRYTFVKVSRSVSLRMRDVSENGCGENQNTKFVFKNFFPKIVPFMR